MCGVGEGGEGAGCYGQTMIILCPFPNLNPRLPILTPTTSQLVSTMLKLIK